MNIYLYIRPDSICQQFLLTSHTPYWLILSLEIERSISDDKIC